MEIDQPTALIVAAGINAVGAAIAAYVSRKSWKTPRKTKGLVLAVRRSLLGPLAWMAFSLVMVAFSVMGILPYWKSQESVTPKTIVIIAIYCISIFLYLSIFTWNLGIVWGVSESRRSRNRKSL